MRKIWRTHLAPVFLSRRDMPKPISISVDMRLVGDYERRVTLELTLQEAAKLRDGINRLIEGAPVPPKEKEKA